MGQIIEVDFLRGRKLKENEKRLRLERNSITSSYDETIERTISPNFKFSDDILKDGFTEIEIDLSQKWEYTNTDDWKWLDD